jgi:hypothetical protein
MENKIETLERLIESKKNTLSELDKKQEEIQVSIDCVDEEIDTLKEQLKTEIRKENGTTIPKERWGVHETHCCEKHGCKYGDDKDCPVVLGLIKQAYGCQIGYDMEEDCFEEEIDFQMKYDEYKLVLEQIESLTKNSSNGEIFKIHEIVKKALKSNEK